MEETWKPDKYKRKDDSYASKDYDVQGAFEMNDVDDQKEPV